MEGGGERALILESRSASFRCQCLSCESVLWRAVCVVRRMECFVCESSRRLCRERRIPRRELWRVRGVVAGFDGDLEELRPF